MTSQGAGQQGIRCCVWDLGDLDPVPGYATDFLCDCGKSLSLPVPQFPVCKMGLVIPFHRGAMGVKFISVCEALRYSGDGGP